MELQLEAEELQLEARYQAEESTWATRHQETQGNQRELRSSDPNNVKVRALVAESVY